MIGAILRSMFRALRCAGLVFFALMTIGAFVSIKKPSDVVFTALLAGITLCLYRTRAKEEEQKTAEAITKEASQPDHLEESSNRSAGIESEMVRSDDVHDDSNACEWKGIKTVSHLRDLTRMPRDFVILDLETTGLNPDKDRIIEVAIVKCRNGAVVSTYQQLINPGIPIPAASTIMNGITDDMVREQPQIHEVIREIFNRINGELVCGYNLSFDLRFLSDAFTSHMLAIDRLKVLDVLTLVKCVTDPAYLLDRKLTTIKECLDIDTQSHRALDDCLATLEVMKECFELLRQGKSLRNAAVKTIVFIVQGSGRKPYEVTFKFDGKKLIARCTCIAARNRLACKHRLSILRGKTDGIISENKHQVSTIASSWLPGTQVEAALKNVEACEKKLKTLRRPDKQAKEELACAKRALTLAMEGVEMFPMSVGFN